MQADTPDKNCEFRSDIHRLRGIAIFLIVATHCVAFFSWSLHPTALGVARDLFDNSTLIFVFISGYLFQHTSSGFQYGKYLTTKFRNVVVPYAIAAMPGILYVMLFDQEKLRALSIDNYPGVEKVAYLLIYGGAQMNYALWFIPVLCLYYLASPIILNVLRRPFGYTLLVFLVPVSVLMHRPSYNHGHNMALAVYFLSTYVMGMLCSKYHKNVVSFLDRFVAPLVALSSVLVFGHILLSQHHGSYVATSVAAFDHADGWVDWLFIQKTLLTFALWGIIRRLEGFKLPFLDSIGTLSFTVYFLHLYVLYLFTSFAHSAGSQIGITSFLGLLSLAVLVPAALAFAVKKYIPRWSRTLVGS